MKKSCETCFHFREDGLCMITKGIDCAHPNWKIAGLGNTTEKGNKKRWKYWKARSVKGKSRG